MISVRMSYRGHLDSADFFITLKVHAQAFLETYWPVPTSVIVGDWKNEEAKSERHLLCEYRRKLHRPGHLGRRLDARSIEVTRALGVKPFATKRSLRAPFFISDSDA